MSTQLRPTSAPAQWSVDKRRAMHALRTRYQQAGDGERHKGGEHRCALQMEPWGPPHIRITAVRAAIPDAFTNATSRAPPRNMLLEESAPRLPALGHELGHVLGMRHIKTILGDQACVADDNAPRCYGETALELANIMGAGRDLWPLNAAPWIERVAAHTRTQAGLWTATMDMKTPPETLTFAQHVLRLPVLVR